MGNSTKHSFNLRAFASVLAGLSFILMTLTGLVLFFAPACRIARDTSWTVWGHSKDQWVAVHVWLSIAFVIASFIHIYLNWTALINYFKGKIRKGWAFRVEWIAALAVCVVLYAGSARGVAPFSSLMAWKETFKHGPAGAEPGRGWRGGRAAGQQAQNHASDAQQYRSSDALNSSEPQGNLRQTEMPAHAPGWAGGGMGRKTLRRFCTDEGIDLPWAISRLQTQGLVVRDAMTMREIADALGVHPREMRVLLQGR